MSIIFSLWLKFGPLCYSKSHLFLELGYLQVYMGNAKEKFPLHSNSISTLWVETLMFRIQFSRHFTTVYQNSSS